MNQRQEGDHITPERFALYYGEGLSEDASAAVEEHVAGCDECATLARRLYSVSTVSSRWLDRRRLEHSRTTVARAVETAQAEVTDPGLRNRLKSWAERWMGRAEGVLRIAWNAGANPLILTGGLDSLLRPQALWHFELQPPPSFGAVRGTRASSGEPPIALALGTPGVRVAISGESEEIEVRVDDVPPGRIAPLVLLCSVTEDRPPRVRELRRVPGTSYWIAQFDRVDNGDYLVAFEPFEH